MGAPSVANVKQYTDTISLLVQQSENRLRPTVVVDTNFRGEQKFYDQLGTDELVEITSRYEDTPTQTPNHARRMVSPRYFVGNTFEDPVDALQMITDPKSAYMQGKVNAANRKWDSIVISALGATAYTGKTGSTSTTLASYNSGSSVLASSSAGMTKTKSIKAKRLLDSAEVESTDRTMLVNSNQMADLMLITEVTSSDFNLVKALYEGEVSHWLGFNWIRSELLTTNDSSERLCYAYHRYGCQLAIQKDVTARMDERPDKNYAWQIYLKLCGGATRLEEARVIQIACVETQWA